MTKEKTKVEALPCPFCGSKAIVEDRWGGFTAECPSRRCGVKPYTEGASRAVVVRRWNKRAS